MQQFAYLKCRDRHLAADLTQEAYARTYAKRPRAAADCETPNEEETEINRRVLKSYIRRVLVNYLKDVQKVGGRWTTILTQDLPDTPAPELVPTHLDPVVKQALTALTWNEKTALTLYYLEEMSYSEILALFPEQFTSINNIAKITQRARTKLRGNQELHDHFEDL